MTLKAYFCNQQKRGRNRITKYSSERFLSSHGQKLSKGFLNSILGQIIGSNLTNARKVTAQKNTRLHDHETKSKNKKIKQNIKYNIITQASRS